MRSRSKAREIALCILYELEIFRYKLNFTDLINTYFENYPKKEPAKNFSLQLVEGVINNLFPIDEVIKKYVKNWEIERIAIIDRNILRIASFELLFLADIPPKVSINEAVELAKKFGDIDSPRFVNGILDKIYKAESKKASIQSI
ncbi:MAG: transcription antitermination factor NusB [Candidatus Omnitrophica bacterium]|nr:transcription antitermination factor NusB [Candidatus Omnitrophota bacterium]MCM8826603.1 transcription antitermination factor NusB [Candidatus Omnitrophota bacterium]